MDEYLKEVFSKNLTRLLKEQDKTQADMKRYMGVSSSTASDWCSGKKIPRMDKIQSLCNWFGVELSGLLEPHEDVPTNGQENEYYLDDETREMLRFLDENPEYKMILSSSKKLKPEDLAIIKAMIERMS